MKSTNTLTPILVTLLLSGPLIGDDLINELPVVQPGAGACIGAGLIFELDDRPTPECHASTIAESSAGIVAAWFAGTEERHPDVGIRVAHFNGRSWSKSVEVVTGIQQDGNRYPCWNPVLFQPSSGPLMLFYKVGPSPSQWWGMLVTSDDGGKTWGQPRKLGQDAKLGEKNSHLAGPVKNKPVELADGSILCPSSTEHDGWRTHFELTRDQGKSWEVIGPINDGSQFATIQPSVLTYADGKLQILCRTRQKVIGSSWSTDGGETWSDFEATELPNPNAGTDAVTLADGRQLLVYNHAIRAGVYPSGRQILNVAMSENGKDWTPILTLEKEKRGEFSYPAVIQAADGKVHITFTYQRESVKHVVLDPARL